MDCKFKLMPLHDIVCRYLLGLKNPAGSDARGEKKRPLFFPGIKETLFGTLLIIYFANQYVKNPRISTGIIL